MAELLGEPVRTDDANHLWIAAEEDFDAAIPMILEELAENRSNNLRESCVFLLDCYADPRHANHVLNSLQREHTLAKQAEQSIYVNCLLTFGERVLKPMMEIWMDSQADAYRREVAKEFLTRFLSKPLT